MHGLCFTYLQYGKLNIGSQTQSDPNSENLQKITFHGKKDLVDAIKLRTLRLEYYSELLGWALNTIPNILVRERQGEN